METLLPFVGMVIVVLAQVSNMVVNKAAMSGGINKFVLIVYSNALSSFILLPCSFIFDRSERPPLSFSILCRLFFLALLGSASQLCGYAGIQYSSPALGTALLNLVPAFTFILSVIFRMEKVAWRSKTSQAKSLGTLVSIIGAFVVTFYKGPPIMTKPSFTVTAPIHHQLLFSEQLNWILGGLLLAAEALTGSAWYVLQALVLKKFPSVSIVMFYLLFFGTILSGLYSLPMVKDPDAWKLKLDMGLFAVLYSAVVLNAFSVSLCSWCLRKTGPLYVSMFKPLGIVFAVAMSIIFLGDVLHLGSLIGSIIIVTGFYAVIWGKAKEKKTSDEKEEDTVGSVKQSSEKVPLLQNKTEETGNSV